MSIFKAGKYNIDFNEKIIIMGILNLTPDSFSDGGMWNNPDIAVQRAIQIEKLGADILDIGGQSTRPGFTKISAQDEWNRIYPVLKKLNRKINIPISIDTFYSEVAEKALNMGVDIVNDISGFRDENMFNVVSKTNCGIIVVHNGNEMNIEKFFKNMINKLEAYGVDKSRICLDPGIGFKQSRNQDKFIINNLNNFRVDNLPMLVGISRKRIISEFYNDKIDNKLLLQGNIVANTLAIANGANILRVHDIEESILTAQIARNIMTQKNI